MEDNSKVISTFASMEIIEKPNSSKKERSIVEKSEKKSEYSLTVHKKGEQKIELSVKRGLRECMRITTRLNTFSKFNKSELKDKLKKEYDLRVTKEDFE